MFKGQGAAEGTACFLRFLLPYCLESSSPSPLNICSHCLGGHMNTICKAIGANAKKKNSHCCSLRSLSLIDLGLFARGQRLCSGLILEEQGVNENDALTVLHLLKLLAAVEARHHFAGIYQAAYHREVIEFICLLMREGLRIVHFPSYTSTC